MKKLISTFLMFAVIVCMITATAITASAAEIATQDGIEVCIATDKDSYASADDINVTVSVKNTNTYDVNGVDVIVELPEGLSLKSGQLSVNDVDIKAGETYTKNVIAVKATSSSEEQKQEDNPTKTEEDNKQTSPQTGDDSNLILWIILLAFSAAGIVLSFKYRKKATKVLSLFLCVAILVAVVPLSSIAADNKNCNIEVDKTIIVNQNKYNIKAKISYTMYSNDFITICFDKRNGESVIIKEMDKGDELIPPTDPTKDGYVFCGWHTNPNAEAWVDSIDLTTYHLTEDTTFYAVWGSADFDIDGDGLSHKEEARYLTNPYLYDSDEDGLSDGEEVSQYYTNPLLNDTDGDGLLDGVEIKLGLNPLNPASDGVTNDADRKIMHSFLEKNYSLTVGSKANIVSSITVSSFEKKVINNSDNIFSPILNIEKRCNEPFETATLVYCYGDSNIGNIDEDQLAILYLNEETGKFEAVPSVIDKGNKTITASLNHFSSYAIGNIMISNSDFSFTNTNASIEYHENDISATETAHSGFDLFKNSFAFHNFQTKSCPGGFCYGFSMVTYLNYIEKLPTFGEQYSTLMIQNLPGYNLNQSLRFSNNQLYYDDEKDIFNSNNNFETDNLVLSESTWQSIYCIMHWWGKQHNVLDHFGINITESLATTLLQSKLRAGEPVLLSLYKWNGGAHSVLAYGMYQTKDADYILVYDSNKPGQKSYVKLSKLFSLYTGAEYDSYSTVRIANVTIPEGPYINHVLQPEAGTLSGKICKASDRLTAIPGATIKVFKDNNLYATKNADNYGNYSIELPAGDYYVTISADGYIDFNSYATVIANENTYMETFLMIKDSTDGTGYARGKVTNSIAGVGVDDVTLTVRKDWNNTNSGATTVATATTTSDGAYLLELPLGNYTVVASKDGYLTSTFNIIVQSGTTGNQNGIITPIVSGNEFLITLTWDENPRDLDSHVEGTLSGGSKFHVYYSHKSQYDGDIEVCNLDYDDTDSYGPEHITLHTTNDNPYYYYIYKYAGNGTVANSEAKITVHQGNTLIAQFNVPTNLGDDDYWNVFAIKDGQLIVKNSITSTQDISYAGTVN